MRDIRASIVGWLVASGGIVMGSACDGAIPSARPRITAAPSVDAASVDAGVATDDDASTPTWPATPFGDAATTPPALDAATSRPYPVEGHCGGSFDAGADGGCGDTSSDPRNCGGCGTDCDGGACQNGACVPLPSGVLATGQHTPMAIAVDSANVYWLNLGTFSGPGGKAGGHFVDGQVMKCAIGGCGNHPTVLASGWGGYQPLAPTALTVDSNNVYWVGDAEILSCGIGGCACRPTIVGSGAGEAAGVAVASGSVYWTMYDVSQVAVCAPGGCLGGPMIFASSYGGSAGIVVDATNVYWTDSGRLEGCPLGGCDGGAAPLWTKQPGSTQAATQGIAVDESHLYWTNGNSAGAGSVMRCTKTSCAATATTIADGRNGPQGIAVDATDVYWVEDQVYKCAIGGCNDTPTVVAPTVGQAIAVDSAHLYFVGAGTSVADDSIVMMPK